MKEQIIALAIAEIAKTLPALAIGIIRILAKPDATEADWLALEEAWRGKTIEGYEQAALIRAAAAAGQ